MTRIKRKSKPKLGVVRGGGAKTPGAIASACGAVSESELEALIHRRGVFEVRLPHPGAQRFDVYMATGEWLKSVELPVGRVTDEVTDSLWRELDEADPLPRPACFRVVR